MSFSKYILNQAFWAVLLTSLPGIYSCRTTGANPDSVSETKDVSDVVSMTRLPDGRYQVVCDNLSPPSNVQVVTREDVLQNRICVGFSGQRDTAGIIEACVAKFGNGNTGATCSQNGINAAAVTACADNFGIGESGLKCVASGFASDIIGVCAEQLGVGERGLLCVKKARYAEVIASCVQQFGSGDTGLRCIEYACNKGVTTECTNAFGNGDRGMQCASKACNASSIAACSTSFGNTERGLACVLQNPGCQSQQMQCPATLHPDGLPNRGGIQ